jgi:hypothetical protein
MSLQAGRQFFACCRHRAQAPGYSRLKRVAACCGLVPAALAALMLLLWLSFGRMIQQTACTLVVADRMASCIMFHQHLLAAYCRCSCYCCCCLFPQPGPADSLDLGGARLDNLLLAIY